MKKNNKIKSIAVRSGAAVLAVLVLSLIFIFTYSKNNRETITKIVSDEINQSLEKSTVRFELEIEKLASSVDVLADLIIDRKIRTGDIVYGLVSLVDTTGAFQAVYVDSSLQGIDNKGDRYDFSPVDYADIFTCNQSGFGYTENDGIHMNKCFYYYKPVNVKDAGVGYIIAYIDYSFFRKCIEDDGYFKSSFYAIADENHKVMLTAGTDSNTTFLSGDLWSNLEKSGKNNVYSWPIYYNSHVMQNIYASYHAVLGNDERYIVARLLGNTDWVVFCGVDARYIDRIVDSYAAPADRLKNQFILSLSIIIVLYIVVIVVMIVRTVEGDKILKGKADTDLLTGLYNKITTEKMITDYITENPGSQGVFIIVDVDNFKKVNDTMGHAFGDEVLRNLGMRLKTLFRATDIIGRIGGDEFVVFLKNIKDMEIIERESRKLERFFRTFEVGEYVKYSVTASLGASIYTMDGKNFEELYKHADEALYNAKHHGKKQLAFYKESEKNFKKPEIKEETKEEK